MSSTLDRTVSELDASKHFRRYRVYARGFRRIVVGSSIPWRRSSSGFWFLVDRRLSADQSC